MAHQLIGIAILLPLAGFLVNGLFGRTLRSEKLVGTLGSATVGLSFLIGCAIFYEMLGSPAEERLHIVRLASWITAGGLDIGFSYQVDQLSVLMLLIVTGVGFVIHVYSIGYMSGDKGFARFFSYLNLFIFAMLNLVMADNFLVLFLGWEGVGLCSYLLIGFWYDRRFDKGTTGDAAKKAFVVNRIGDFGFLVGMFLIFERFGTLTFESVFAQAAVLPVGTSLMFWITLALFFGATGKSAQIPLFVWLPDAMAGPTPVSALIHAATMVTAGVYMVARCSLLFALAPTTMYIVAVVGAVTAFVAASIGLVQNDIKKVLAYSTISQLGYMFLGLGVGAFAAGLFHVLTHAFFKALLFLGSGAVIHALHDEQDIQKMGGLKQHLPITYWTFLVGSVAIAGIPPFAGFFSKDEILWKTFANGNWVLWAVGLLVAGLTAFYMFRLVTLTFEGKARYDTDKHPHEAPATMTIPLIVLAALSVVGGFVGLPASLGGGNAIEHWLDPVFERAQEALASAPHGVEPVEYVLMALSVLVAAAGILGARRLFLKRRDIAQRIETRKPRWYTVLFNKYYVDEIYDAVVVTPTVKGSERLLWNLIDIGIIDWLVNGTAQAIAAVSRVGRMVQTGVTQGYVFVFMLGVVTILGWLLFQ